MKLFGIALLLFGFLWIAVDTADTFVGYQHTRWMWQSQHLPEGETIKRTDAIAAMRDLSLALKDRHRVVFLPALLMLAGGLVAAFSRRKQKSETPVTADSDDIKREPEQIKLSEGQTLLVIVKDERVIEYAWDMGLPHVEFVKRRVGKLPEGAWVGTVSKFGKDVAAISSKYFYGFQMPASESVTAAVRALFK